MLIQCHNCIKTIEDDVGCLLLLCLAVRVWEDTSDKTMLFDVSGSAKIVSVKTKWSFILGEISLDPD